MNMRNLSNSQTSGLKINDICEVGCDQGHKMPQLIYIPPQENLRPEAIPKEQHKELWCRTAWIQCLSSGWFLIKVIFL